jgi:hypothetical protein
LRGGVGFPRAINCAAEDFQKSPHIINHHRAGERRSINAASDLSIIDVIAFTEQRTWFPVCVRGSDRSDPASAHTRCITCLNLKRTCWLVWRSYFTFTPSFAWRKKQAVKIDPMRTSAVGWREN